MAAVLTLKQIFRTLIDTYYVSILRNLHNAYLVPAGNGILPFILDNPILLDGTECAERRLVPVTSWRSLEVVHIREREIEVLLNGSFLCVGEGGISWPRFHDPAHRSKLRDILKKALYQCDAIGDIETVAVTESDAERSG